MSQGCRSVEHGQRMTRLSCHSAPSLNTRVPGVELALCTTCTAPLYRQCNASSAVNRLAVVINIARHDILRLSCPMSVTLNLMVDLNDLISLRFVPSIKSRVTILVVVEVQVVLHT